MADKILVSSKCVSGWVWDIVHIPSLRCEVDAYGLQFLKAIYSCDKPHWVYAAECGSDPFHFVDSSEGRFVAIKFGTGSDDDAARRNEQHSKAHAQFYEATEAL